MVSSTRREFLFLAGALALPWQVACASDPRRATGVFRHGVASGDPLADRVILWTRLTVPGGDPVTGGWTVARDPGVRTVVRQGAFRTDAGRDHTVKVDVTDLAPGTTYYYRFQAHGEHSAVGRTRTLARGATARVRLALVSCSDFTEGYFNAYRRLGERADLDAVVHVGDYLYENGDAVGAGRQAPPQGRAHQPAREIVTLADYRARYAQYRADPDLQEAHRQHPWICGWDDHESANNAWRDGADAHNPATEGDWAVRRAAAARAYHEWMPIRTPDPADLTRIHRAFSFGDLVQLVMLETRLGGRDRQAPPGAARVIHDPARSMLGPRQEAWRSDVLGADGALWRVLGNQTMFAQLQVLNTFAKNQLVRAPLPDIPANPDQWDGYAPNRQRIFDLVRGQRVPNLVVVSGDVHSSWASDLSVAPADPAQYDPITGRGALGVEFVTPSVTSPGSPELDRLADLVRLLNTHIKYVETRGHGYVLVDFTPQRCQGEYWYVDTITTRASGERLARALYTDSGNNHLRRAAAPTLPRAEAPALAPDAIEAAIATWPRRRATA